MWIPQKEESEEREVMGERKALRNQYENQDFHGDGLHGDNWSESDEEGEVERLLDL